MLESHDSRLDVVPGNGIAGSERLLLSELHRVIGDDGRLAAMDCWVTGRGNVVRSDPTAIWARIAKAGQIITPGPSGTVKQVTAVIAGEKYPVLRFPSAANQFILANYTLPPSYAIYCSFTMSVSVGAAGLAAQQDPAGDGMAITVSGSAGSNVELRHNGSDTDAQVTATNSFFTNGQISIVWGSFNASDLSAVVGGMNTTSGNVVLSAKATKTFDRQHKITDRFRFGMGTGAIGKDIIDTIIFPTGLYTSNLAMHEALLTAMATYCNLGTEA